MGSKVALRLLVLYCRILDFRQGFEELDGQTGVALVVGVSASRLLVRESASFAIVRQSPEGCPTNGREWGGSGGLI